MLKRFLSAAIALVCVLTALFVYRQSTQDLIPAAPYKSDSKSQDDTQTTETTDTMEMIPISQGATIGQVAGVTFTTRDKNGRIKKQSGFLKRLGNVEGLFQISQPWVRFFDYNNQRATHITARMLTTPTEIAGALPETGRLDGNVRIEMYPLTPKPDGQPVTDDPNENQSLDLLIELDSVFFQREFSRITSDGPVNITSPRFRAKGRILNVQYDQIANNLSELQIRHIDYLHLIAADPASQPPPPPSATDETTKPAGPSKPTDPTTRNLYRMSLSDNVVVRQGSKRLLADKIEFIADTKTVRPGMQQPQTNTQTQSILINPQTLTDEPASGDFLGDFFTGEKTTILTCDGPLRITPVDEQEAKLFHATLMVNASGRPLQIWQDDRLIAQMERLKYDHAARVIQCLAGPSQSIRLALSENIRATAYRQARFETAKALATLTGPGRVETTAPDGTVTSEIAYQDQIRVKFASSTQTRQPQWLDFTGHLQAQTPNGQLEANKGKVTFYEPHELTQGHLADPNDGRWPVKLIQLAGDVRLQSNEFHSTSQSLTARFKDNSPGQTLQSLIAQKDVTLDTPDYSLQTDDLLEMTFDDPQPPQTSRENPSKPSTSNTRLGFDQILRRQGLRNVRCRGSANRVRLVNKKEQYQIVGDRLDGNAITNRWEVRGNPATITGLTEKQVLQHLESDLFIANMDTGTVEMPRAGSMIVMSQYNLTGDRFEEPIPLRIQWANSATYLLNQNRMILFSVIVEASGPRGRDHMLCPILTVTLAEKKTTEKTQDQNSPHLYLETLRAHGGSVLIRSERTNPATGQLSTLTTMVSQTLEFDNESNSLKAAGPGWFELTEYPDEPHAIGQNAPKIPLDAIVNPSPKNRVEYTLVTFQQQMVYRLSQNEVSFIGQVTLDRLPLVENLQPDETGTPGIEGIQRLSCRRLRFVVPTKTKSDSTANALESFLASGNFVAHGNIVYETLLNHRHHIFAAETLSFDSQSHIIEIIGSKSAPVHFDQMKFLWVRINHLTGDIDSKPLESEFANQL